jgi:hypothetical protein
VQFSGERGKAVKIERNESFTVTDICKGVGEIRWDGSGLSISMDAAHGDVFVKGDEIDAFIEALQEVRSMIPGLASAPIAEMESPREIDYLVDCDGDLWDPAGDGRFLLRDGGHLKLNRAGIEFHYGSVHEVYKR